MANPALQVPTSVPVQLSDPTRKPDTIDTLARMRQLRKRMRVLASITALSSNNYGDEYVADLYADGRVTLSAPEYTCKTHSGVLIYNPDIYTAYNVGDLLFVTLNNDGTATVTPNNVTSSPGVYVVFGSSLGGAQYNGLVYPTIATATTLDGATAFTGTSGLGVACLIYNGAEFGWSGSPFSPKGPRPGIQIGIDAGSGKAIILTDAQNNGLCTSTGG